MSEQGRGPRGPGQGKRFSGHLGRRAALETLLVICLTGLLAGTGAYGAARARTGAGFQSGTLRVTFTNDACHPVVKPYIAVANAFPGMTSRDVQVVVENTGSLGATYSVSVAVASSSAPRSLDNVLMATVTDKATGRVTYTGSLSNLSFSTSARLAPNECRRFAVRISWPTLGARDIGLQGQSLSFALRVTAHATAE